MQNGTMLQYFHWYYPTDGSLWKQLKKDAGALVEMGITAVWLPPAFKADAGGMSVGYDIYDLYDLGEFEQKSSLRTKYGNKLEYLDAIRMAHEKGLQVYVDIVVNHLAGADESETIKVRKVDPENRNEFISEPYDIEAFTKFTYPGRQKKYSAFEWDHRCFTGVDFDNMTKESGIYSIMNEYGEGWEDVVDEEKGNYDYLMYADIEFRNPAVREELKRWADWYYNETKFDGVRLDAVKHISPDFYRDWLDYVRTSTKKDLFAVGEYWAPGNLTLMLRYIDATDGKMSLFDAALHHNLHNASKSGKDYDLTTIFDNTLLSSRPELAVTVVDNHDTQPLQALEAPVEPWFKPIAYALILLIEKGYPCVFYPDIFGATYTDKGSDGNEYEIYLPGCENIDKLLAARKSYAYGVQRNYFDHGNCIGWTREGIPEMVTSGCAVLLSNGDEGFKKMEMGPAHKGKTFIDYLGKFTAEVQIDEDGFGEFHCLPGSVSVWIQK
ncbi:MAG: alpha-amylase [Chitinophagaceae bacterium]